MAVVGGGISGLVAARELMLAGADVVVLERAPRPGGVVQTEVIDGRLVEHGPDSFVVHKGSVLALAEELGLVGEVIDNDRDTAGTYIWWDGALHRLPEGLQLVAPSRLGPTLRSPLFSATGKARILCDLVIPRRTGGGDESLGSFVTRRMGRQMLERVAEPMVAGIHAATPDTMSLRAGFPRLPEMEAAHRSLILAARRGARSAASSAHTYFASMERGMGALIEGLVGSLSGVELRTREEVTALEPGRSGGYTLRLATGEQLGTDGVVLAVPARDGARLLETLSPTAAAAVAGIPQVSTTVVNLAYRGDDLHDLAGHGFVVPDAQGRRILGVTYITRKWGSRDRESGVAMVRGFIGGSRGQALTRESAETQIAVVREELATIAGITAPPLSAVARTWDGGLHQYTMRHLDRVATAESTLAAHPRVALAGAAFHGIGLNECVDSGRRAAMTVLSAGAGR